VRERWARLRFSIIDTLLAAPPAKGALRATLRQLAAREWRHPISGAPIRFSVSTPERWLYRSRNEKHDPVRLLRRKQRDDAGEQTSMTPSLRQALLAQYNAHKSWSATLHLQRVGADLRARYVSSKCFDGNSTSIDMPSALHPQTVLALDFLDKPLAPEWGAPVRLRIPTKLGFKSAKDIQAISVTNTYPGGYWEDQGYNWFSGS
jgi:hypothetical protein